MEYNRILAVDINIAPQSVQDELESLQGRVHSMNDMDKVSPETKRWIMEHADHIALADKMGDNIRDMLLQMQVMIKGITMLETIMPKSRADKLNLQMFNACAEFIREYNTVHMEDDS